MCIVCMLVYVMLSLFFFNEPATTAIYTYLHTLSLHDALPSWVLLPLGGVLASVVGFLLLLTPDTDRDAMIAKYGGPDATFVAGPAGQRIHYRDQGRADGTPSILLHGAKASLHKIGRASRRERVGP